MITLLNKDHLERLNSWRLKSCKHVPEFIPVAWIIGALACNLLSGLQVLSCIKLLLLSNLPWKGPAEMISASPKDETRRNQGERERKASFSPFHFIFPTYCGFIVFILLFAIFTSLPTSLSQTLPWGLGGNLFLRYPHSQLSTCSHGYFSF